jgi:TRAP-type C4-dicarboxylate transport system substrate-binding protein
MRATLAAVAMVLVAAKASAAPDHVLRMATLAPDGTPWAREMRAFVRNVEESTHGSVTIKVYFGGVAGDEEEVLRRIRRGQLDGAVAGMLCEKLAPSMRVADLPGLFQSRAEATAIMTALQADFSAEAAKQGFEMPATMGLGPDIYFTKRPVHSFTELRQQRLFNWSIDEVTIAMSRAMGLTIVPLEVNQAMGALTSDQVDGVLATPSEAISFQWLSSARFYVPLLANYGLACMIMPSAVLNRLPPKHRASLRSAAARMSDHMETIGRAEEAEFLSGKSKYQATQVPPSAAFRSEYFAAARAVRERLGVRFVPRPLLDRVLRMLADYRAENPSGQ